MNHSHRRITPSARKNRSRLSALLPLFFAACLFLLPFRALAASPSLNQKQLILVRGQSFSLSVKGAAAPAFHSRNPAVATVSASGVVTAISPGKAVIRVKAGKKTLKCQVQVYNGVATDRKVKSIGGSWKLLNGRKYYLLKNGSLATGVRRIKGITYVLDLNGALQQPGKNARIKIGNDFFGVSANGLALTGWHVIGKKLYYMNDRGQILKSRTVEGIRLAKNGAAKKSALTTWQMAVSRTVDAITDDQMTKEEKLRVCWDFLTDPDRFEYAGKYPDQKENNWWKMLAFDMLTTRSGNCYGSACAFAAMAHTLGFDASVVTGEMYDYGDEDQEREDDMTEHGWVIIDGLYYDPELDWVDVYPDLYGFETYDNEPFNILKIIPYA